MSYSNYDLNTKITALASKTSAIIPSPFNVLDVVDTVIVEDGLGTGNNTTITPVEVSLTDGSTTDYLSMTPTTLLIDNVVSGETSQFGSSYLTFVQSLVTVNTLDANNWSGGVNSQATTMNGNHYITGSMLSTTGSDKLQKSANIYFNPSSNTLTAPLFVGDLTGSAGNSNTINVSSLATSTVCYPIFSSSSSGPSKTLYVDDTPTTLTYNPSSGSLTSTTFTGGIILPTTSNTATYTLGTTLTVAGISTSSLRNSNITFTGGSNTVSILTIVNSTQVNGEYYVGILNNGSGNLTFQTSLGTNIKTTYSSNVNISPASYALMKLNILTINSLTVYIISLNQLTN